MTASRSIAGAGAPPPPRLSAELTRRDTLRHWGFRWGIGRMHARVEPGLYRIGDPSPASPVIVTCNYRMTVDLVRRDLAGVDVWLLVLETYGINVWCAAGKGTFGTDELVRRIFDARMPDHVEHETLVLPQFGAVGVSADAVRAATGYRVVWGPIRSSDLREFLGAGMKATPEMRAVTFTLRERLALAPMELVPALKHALWAVPLLVALAVLSGSIGLHEFRGLLILMALFPSLAIVALGIFAGTVEVPALLPWLPGRAFTVKGGIAGGLLALAALFALPGMLGGMNPWAWAAVLFAVAAIGSYLGVNFTGSTPYTSPSGVEFELRRAIPLEISTIGIALACWIVSWGTITERLH
jgi:hypothetical protein